MGRGIAQLLAQAGRPVVLYDQSVEAATSAIDAIEARWATMVARDRLSDSARQDCVARLSAAQALEGLAGCDLVIEAVVEDLAVKRTLFAALEQRLVPSAVIASNTSSLSITALAQGLSRPGRFAGLHFFNPAPLMRLVEVVPGLRTEARVCDALVDFVRTLGHEPVRARDTPGFIVNHAGRGYLTEALRIVEEGVADFGTVDRVLRDQLGFRLGPFELMDLTGLDVTHPVMVSLHQQFFGEPRLRPSVITAQRLAGGVLGRKTGNGFYRYEDGEAVRRPEAAVPSVAALPPVWVSPHARRRDELLALLARLGASVESGEVASERALCLVAPLGWDVTGTALSERLDPVRTVGIDWLLPDAQMRRRVLATTPATGPAWRDAAHALLARDDRPVSMIRDSAGFIAQRVLATIVNIGADICQQGICSPTDLDLAVQLGLGYPDGPLTLGDRCGAVAILEILRNMQTVGGDPRYRPSPWLRRRAELGLSLLHPDPA